MPKRLAESDPAKPVSDAIGSGPFVFVKEEWVPGTKIVYRNSTDTCRGKSPRAPSRAARSPRSTASNGTSCAIPLRRSMACARRGSTSGAAAARRRNQRQSVKGLVVKKLNPLGDHGVFIINHLQPPFDKPQARQALLRMIKQTDYLSAIATDPEYYQACKSFLACNTPYQTMRAAKSSRQ